MPCDCFNTNSIKRLKYALSWMEKDLLSKKYPALQQKSKEARVVANSTMDKSTKHWNIDTIFFCRLFFSSATCPQTAQTSLGLLSTYVLLLSKSKNYTFVSLYLQNGYKSWCGTSQCKVRPVFNMWASAVLYRGIDSGGEKPWEMFHFSIAASH